MPPHRRGTSRSDPVEDADRVFLLRHELSVQELDIGAGNKGAARCGDHDGLQGRILSQQFKGAHQAFINVQADGVHRRFVNDDHSHICGIGWPLELYDVVHAHRSLP
jgi:hypothetical protein